MRLLESDHQATFLFDSRTCNQHDPKPRGATLGRRAGARTPQNARDNNVKTLGGAVMIDLFCRGTLIALGLLLGALSSHVHAQSASRTVTLVVPYAAGGGTDTVARLIGERMSRALGQTVVIENVVGGGGTLAN